MRNNKGFTMIELLGVVVILGILMGIAIPAVSKYLSKSKVQSIETMADAAYEAANTKASNDFYLKNGTYYKLVDLWKEGYMDRPIDPDTKTGECDGRVTINIVSSTSSESLNDYSYRVDIVCSVQEIHIIYHTDGTKETTTTTLAPDDTPEPTTAPTTNPTTAPTTDPAYPDPIQPTIDPSLPVAYVSYANGTKTFTFNFQSGQTWQEFINSSYNTYYNSSNLKMFFIDYYTEEGDKVAAFRQNTRDIWYLSGNANGTSPALPNSKITAGHTYYPVDEIY